MSKFILLTYAYLCFSCKVIFELAPYGRCPRCQSKSIYPVQSFVPAWQGVEISYQGTVIDS